MSSLGKLFKKKNTQMATPYFEIVSCDLQLVSYEVEIAHSVFRA